MTDKSATHLGRDLTNTQFSLFLLLAHFSNFSAICSIDSIVLETVPDSVYDVLRCAGPDLHKLLHNKYLRKFNVSKM